MVPTRGYSRRVPARPKSAGAKAQGGDEGGCSPISGGTRAEGGLTIFFNLWNINDPTVIFLWLHRPSTAFFGSYLDQTGPSTHFKPLLAIHQPSGKYSQYSDRQKAHEFSSSPPCPT